MNETIGKALFVTMLIAMTLLAACMPASPSQDATQSPLAPSPLENANRAASSENALTASAQADLAGRLGVSPDEIEVVSVEAVEWGDSSLGCPQEGMMYAQVITPGYRIVLSYEGETYAYHTGAQADSAVIYCPEAQNEPFPTADAGGDAMQSTSAALVARATADLAQRLDMDASQIEVVSVRAVEWRDGSLDCARGGMMVPQVITPGYLIVLSAGGVKYEYHTSDWAGGLVKFCGQAKKSKGDGSASSS